MRQMTETEILLSVKSQKQKSKIIDWINTKNVQIDIETRENLIDSISCIKNFLNEELSFCEPITEIESNTGLYQGLISAKNSKIDKLVDLYNNSNTYNKIKFVNSEIVFNKITTLENIMLEIDNFDFTFPIGFKFAIYTYDGEIIIKDIIPFNYDGLFNEFINTKEKLTSTFKVANKNNIYIYSCIYDENSFSIGTELKLEENKHYSFTRDGYLVFDSEQLGENKLIIKYQPNENSFEIPINKKITNVELLYENDFMKVGSTLSSRMVMVR